ncbi:MAG: GYD domain-containing protein [Dehalococcoidales bacterium]|nr:GYD domain-containing protein [Dehalococcoidales bacterium]
MAYYMLQVAYDSESLAYQIKNPQNVAERTKAVVEKLGGRLECTYYSFGEYDLVQIIECPDNISAASIPIVAASGGAIKAARTTPLLTVEEGMKAFKKAADVTYKPPV